MVSHLRAVPSANDDDRAIELPGHIPAVKRTAVDPSISRALWESWGRSNPTWRANMSTVEQMDHTQFKAAQADLRDQYLEAEFNVFAATDEKQYIQCKEGEAASKSLQHFNRYYEILSEVEADKQKVLLEIHNLARYIKSLKSLVIAYRTDAIYDALTPEQKRELIRNTVDACMPLAGFGVDAGVTIPQRVEFWRLVKDELGADAEVIAKAIASDEKLARTVPDVLVKGEWTVGAKSGSVRDLLKDLF